MKVIIFLFVIIPAVILFYYSSYQQQYDKILYVSNLGDDYNEGSKKSPFRSIQKAINSSKGDTLIKISPGIYREQLNISDKGNPEESLKLEGDSLNKEKIEVYGSVSSSLLNWTVCNRTTCADIPVDARQKVYYTNIKNTEIPHDVYEITGNNQAQRLYLARSPNFKVTIDSKYHEHWWTAKESPVNQYILADKANLTNIQNFIGATAYIMDGSDRCGTFFYKQKVKDHDNINGTVRFDTPVGNTVFGLQETGIGPFSKYYLEGLPQLLDSPGEWFYDKNKKLLYLWPIENSDPATLNIEIAFNQTGLKINNSSNITVEGITFRYINGIGVMIQPDEENNISNIHITNSKILFADRGLVISAPNPKSTISNTEISNIEIGNTNKNSVMISASDYSPPNITGLNITRSVFHNSSFADNGSAVEIARIKNLTFTNNLIYNTAFNALQLTGFEKKEYVSSDILIGNNTIENACQNSSYCAGLKIYGGRYVNVRVSGNIVKNNLGWSYCQNENGNIQGIAEGIFISNANGVEIDRNIVYKNSGAAFYVYPRQIEANNNIFLNNLAGYSDIGIDLISGYGAPDLNQEVHRARHDNTVIKNNVFLENRIGLQINAASPEKLQVDYNAFIDNGRDVNSNIMSSSWNQHSVKTSNTAFNNADKLDFNLPFNSILRGKGEPTINNPFIDFQLDFLGLSNDIGPCKFRLIGNSCRK